MFITKQILAEKGAWLGCEALKIFAAEWPDGAETTEANIRRAGEIGIYLDWFAEKFLSALALAKYAKACDSALAEFEKVRDSAWEEYLKVRDFTLYEMVRNSALAEYEKVRNSAWEEYLKVRDPALEEFEKVRNFALLQAIIDTDKEETAR